MIKIILLAVLGSYLLLWVFRFTLIFLRWVFQSTFAKIFELFSYKLRLRDEFTNHERMLILGGKRNARKCRRCIFKKGRIFLSRRATQVDHLWPSYWGGPAKMWNGAPLCSECNQEKSKSIEGWAMLQLFLPGTGWRRKKWVQYPDFSDNDTGRENEWKS